MSFDHIRNIFVFAVLRKKVSGLWTLDFIRHLAVRSTCVFPDF